MALISETSQEAIYRVFFFFFKAKLKLCFAVQEGIFILLSCFEGDRLWIVRRALTWVFLGNAPPQSSVIGVPPTLWMLLH